MILGLTGAIGSGKSTALAIFQKFAAQCYDADRLCHEILAGGDPELNRQMQMRWGAGVFDTDGIPDRKKIGAVVFQQPGELAFLTGLLYPGLQQKITQIAGEARKHPAQLTVLEVPLLFEEGMDCVCDKVAALWTDRLLRHQRLIGRGLEPAEITRREAKQWSAEKKLECADFALINHGTPEFLEMQIKKLIQMIQESDL